jgi:arginyl-tRNA synthetase
VAERAVEAARAQPSFAGLIAHAEVAGPGFVNLDLDTGYLGRQLLTMATDQRLDVAPDPEHQVVVVDYSHPNVAKEMHVGHLRTTIIGDAIARLQGFLGHQVIRANHVGDWGTPFGMLIEHLLDLGETEAADELSVGDLNGFYQQARAKFDGDDAFKDRSRERVVLLQGGDPETLRLWGVLVAESGRYFQAVYDRLDVLLEPGDLAGESSYNDQLASVVEELSEKGLLVDSDGALCVFPPGFTNREGEPLPLIVEMSGGRYGYGATDLAAIRHRICDLHATRILYVVGAPQRDHLEMVFAVARLAGWLVPPVEAEHVAFGSVLGSDRRMLRTRAGASLKLIELLDEAVERAAAKVAEKNPDLDDATRAAVAEAVGIGAVKYADLSNDRVKDYVFDWDRMLSFDGNTAPYLQYAHARIRSIFRRGEVDRATLATDPPVIAEPAERALALQLLGFEGAIRLTAERSQPHRLCTYLFELASSFTTFYEACPVLRAESDVRRSRLLLSDLTARTLELGLGLLGIATPDRM